MSGKILYPVDFSPFSVKLLGCGDELARVGMDEMIILHVNEAKRVADYGDHPAPGHTERSRQAREELEELLAETLGREFKAEIIVETGEPVPTILDVAKQEDVDLIFMGSHGKGFLHRRILGSVSDRVLRLADRPVLIQECRINKKEGGYSCENACTSLLGHVLVANDFSNYAEKVKPVLARFAQSFCTRVTLLHVQEGPDTWGTEIETRARAKDAQKDMDRLVEMGNYLGPYCRGVETIATSGEPVPKILQVAEDLGVTLIVVGALGKHEGHGDLVGSVTEKLVRKSDIPVLVLKA